MNTYIIGGSSLAAAMLLIIIVLFIKNHKLKKKSSLLVVSLARVEELVEFAKKDNVDNDVHKENFIKFISDSRDWAYEYIEDVQKGIAAFVDGVEPEIAYFDEYGLVGEAYPHYHSMKKISQAYKELKKLLPEQEEA